MPKIVLSCVEARVKVRVPATTANLGSGFDTLGMALAWHNWVEVEVSGGEAGIEVEGEGQDALPRDESNIAHQAMAAAFWRAGKELPPLRLKLKNTIPLARGLGSSAAARVGALKAANVLLGGALSDNEILQLAAELEGHPDNAAAALFGGLVVSGKTESGKVFALKLRPIVPLRAVVLVPNRKVATEEARKVLPKEVPHQDAVFNLSRASLLVGALVSGKLEHLREAMQDRLHQPYRQKLMPWLPDVFQAALSEEALGACVSGAGSSVLALTRDDERANAVGQAMLTALRHSGEDGFVRVVEIDFDGCQVEEVQ